MIYYSGITKLKKGISKYKEQNKSKIDILFENIHKLVKEKREKDKLSKNNSSNYNLKFQSMNKMVILILEENKFKLRLEKKQWALK